MDESIIIRPFKPNDLTEGILDVLSALGPTTKPQTDQHVAFLKSIDEYGRHEVWVACVKSSQKIVGTITCLLERKITHSFGCVAHIEDVAVHPDFQGKGIAQMLIRYAEEYAEKAKAYKIILNCNEDLIPFYEKSGFRTSGVQMRKDLLKL